MIVLADIFVTRLGHVGLHFQCPHCGRELIHGGYPPYDIREAFEAVHGWRLSHCHHATRDAPDHSGEYQLKRAPGPTRYAPGAERSRRARATMNYLRSIGIAISEDTILSGQPLSWWTWR